MTELTPIQPLSYVPIVTQEKQVTFRTFDGHIEGRVKVEAITDEWLVYDYQGMVKTSHRASTIDYLV